MLSVGIIGGTGYTGKYLVKFCGQHPHISEINIYSHSSAGQKLDSIFPEFAGILPNLTLKSTAEIDFNCDVYFSALPHGKSLDIIPQIIDAGKLVIDLSGDFRLNSNELYKDWYGFTHNSEELLNNKVYGLADFPETEYGQTQLISNPGCYPTSVLLSVLPFVKEFGNSALSITTNSYSGTSGAGKTPKQNLLMSEMFGNVTAYKVNAHQHTPEIQQEINNYNSEVPFSFTTHLLPVAVGIYSTTVIHTKENIDENLLKNFYKEFYSNSFFVRLKEEPPLLTHTVGTNFCDINVSSKNNIVVITAAIDNLIKGASGQAIQNLNKYFGWDETAGIIEKTYSQSEIKV